MGKKLMVLALAAIMLLGVFGLTGCNQKASKYTEDEHIQRITKRITARYIDGDEKLRPYDKPTDDGVIYPKVKASGFEVYPLYNENDVMKHALVEFEPFGFLFVHIRDEQLKGFSWLGASTSMYMLSSIEGEPTSENNYRSPFYNTADTSEKMYLININGYIPAKKSNGVFVNLLSNKKFEVVDGEISDEQVTIEISFINKKHFDL